MNAKELRKITDMAGKFRKREFKRELDGRIEEEFEKIKAWVDAGNLVDFAKTGIRRVIWRKYHLPFREDCSKDTVVSYDVYRGLARRHPRYNGIKIKFQKHYVQGVSELRLKW